MGDASVRLRISVRRIQVLADLEFMNTSRHDVFIEKFNACVNGEIENNVFEIRADGHLLDYTGMLAKRRRPLLEDYLRLPPGQPFTTQVDLTRAYDFPRGKRTYEAAYSAVLSYPERDGIWTLTSDTERFSFVR
jgi:hypothetical protein